MFPAAVERYQNLIYAICYHFVRDSHLAQDLAQETFLSAYTHLDSFSGDDMKPWLSRIAANKAKDHLKSAWARRVQTQEALPLERALPDPDTPPFLAENAEGVGRIKDAVESLKEPYLLVSRLYFFQQLSVAEIALRLGRPAKTVETQLYRARHRLQELLREEGQGP